MTLYKFLAGFFFVHLSSNSFCQEQKIFRRILTSKEVGKIYKSATINDTTWRIYLGALQDKNKKDKYYVIREFNKIRASSTWHGHSTIYFFNLEKKRAALVYVDMPDNLPFKLAHNTFYFKFMENGVVKDYKMAIQTPLPKFFCSRKNVCDEITFD